MKSFEYVSPDSADGAIAVKTPDAMFKAGGMDLLDLMKSGVGATGRVITLHRMENLKGISVDERGATVGALTTLAEIASHPHLAGHFTALAEAAGQAATPQVRNVATLGGNILQRPRCWYFRLPQYPCLKKGGETCYALNGENKFHAIFETNPCPIVHPSNTAVALTALRAEVFVTSGTGRRKIPVEEFFVTPKQDIRRENVLKEDDIVTHIFIPATKAKSRYIEFREKQSFDWALASAAAVAEPDGTRLKSARVVLGAVAPVPKILDLGTIEATDDALEKIAQDAVLTAAPLAQNRYKVQLAKVAIKRSLLALAGSAP